MLSEHEQGGLEKAVFFDREQERKWLLERVRRRGPPIIITGVGGVGKTALLHQVLGSLPTRQSPLIWTVRSAPGEAMAEIVVRVEELVREHRLRPIVAIDEADVLSGQDLNVIVQKLMNWKIVKRVIIASRFQPDLAGAEALHLRPFSRADAETMLRRVLGGNVSPELLDLAGEFGGLPLALSLFAGFARGRSPHELANLLRGEIYKLDQQIIIPERRLITNLKPQIIFANQMLVERLRRRPEAVYDLPPRRFEELIAELLTDMGYEVELTPQTRDGGKDILAYMNTPAGRLLCLVEAKKYRRDRRVGVELVRQLYGTLVDADANSAMLVTTSAFSPDARGFQQRHQYKLSLRDYGHLVEWINGYGKQQHS